MIRNEKLTQYANTIYEFCFVFLFVYLVAYNNIVLGTTSLRIFSFSDTFLFFFLLSRVITSSLQNKKEKQIHNVFPFQNILPSMFQYRSFYMIASTSEDRDVFYVDICKEEKNAQTRTRFLKWNWFYG